MLGARGLEYPPLSSCCEELPGGKIELRIPRTEEKLACKLMNAAAEIGSSTPSSKGFKYADRTSTELGPSRKSHWLPSGSRLPPTLWKVSSCTYQAFHSTILRA